MSALPSYNEIVDLLKKGATFDAQQKIMELREACISLEDEAHNLKRKVRDLENAVRFKEELVFRVPFYYLKDDNEPFCPRCWEKDRTGIHLSPEVMDGNIHVRPCPECEAKYKTRDVDFGPMSG